MSLFATLLVGCDARIEKFGENKLYGLTLAKSRSTPSGVAVEHAAAVVDELFGSPESPTWPERVGMILEIDSDRLSRAAGAVSSLRDGTHRGLYREHCVVCHSLEGSGAGPASLFQNPYPRNFRRGIFKWKSTERAEKPSREDLMQLLAHGVPGSAMPSFAILAEEDLDALVDYVIYLSIRGEVERRLIAAAIDDLDYGESVSEALRLNTDWQSEGGQVVGEVLTEVAEGWANAREKTVPVPSWTPLDGEPLLASIERGKATFHGQIANCVGCHGPSGNGSAVTLDYDDWTKEFSTQIGLTPTNRDAMRPFRKVGALKPRQINPRNLQSGDFRGGSDPQTLFRRITQGIAGTPMPAVELVDSENGKGLTNEQVWDLVRYLQFLVASKHEKQVSTVKPLGDNS